MNFKTKVLFSALMWSANNGAQRGARPIYRTCNGRKGWGVVCDAIQWKRPCVIYRAESSFTFIWHKDGFCTPHSSAGRFSEQLFSTPRDKITQQLCFSALLQNIFYLRISAVRYAVIMYAIRQSLYCLWIWAEDVGIKWLLFAFCFLQICWK